MRAGAARQYDVLIAGTGPVGLSAAVAIAQLGLKTCASGRVEAPGAGRTVALLQGSLDFYRRLGALDAIAAASAPLEVMRIVDDTDTVFHTRPVEFRAQEIGLPLFGRNIESAALAQVLTTRAQAEPSLTLEDGLIEDYAFRSDEIEARVGGDAISARLLIAADGRQSPARAAAAIGAQTWAYAQTALTAIFAHERPHLNVSTELHTRGGPFTLVPLPGSASEPHRSSLVWMMRPREARRRMRLEPADFAREAERQAHSLLGKMRLLSRVGAQPMSGLRATRLTGPRLALAGEAAHGFPPIGAQGLNLGLRDAACLADAVRRAPDPGAPDVLAAYRRGRAIDVSALTFGVDLANRSFGWTAAPVDVARGLGLLALAELGPLRRAVMRAGLGPAAIAETLRTAARRRRSHLG
jgi:2-octaprenyl-6-methoxyphenol hydroxylase